MDGISFHTFWVLGVGIMTVSAIVGLIVGFSLGRLTKGTTDAIDTHEED